MATAAHKLVEAGFIPRGLNRVQAATYVGVGPTKFDELVRDGLMPAPKKIGSRAVWDRFALDAAFEELPDTENAGVEDLDKKLGL